MGGAMKNLKQKPSKAEGNVGDVVRVLGREYQKSPNGAWSPVVNSGLLLQIKQAYAVDGLTLRATAKRVSDEAHTFSPSVIQNIVNAHGWMRSHYGEAKRKDEDLNKNKKVLFKLFDDEAFSIPDLALVTGLTRNVLAPLFERNGRAQKAGCRPSEARVNTSRRMSKAMAETWNRVLSTDVNELTYDEYRSRVRRLTDLVYRLYRTHDHNEREYLAHLDHVFSIHDGYWERRAGKRVKRRVVVPFSLIAHPINLSLIGREANLAKGDRSGMTLDTLTKRVNKSRVQLKPINRNEELRMVAAKYKLRPYDQN
jgi:hypothetical protein